MTKSALLARQPICDVNKEVVAYELLFRYEDGSGPIGMDGNSASAEVLLNTFCESGINSITGGLPAFINFTESLLEHLLVFDPESLCIEILEGVEITEELIEKVNNLKEYGFKIAVDHFVWNEKYKPLLELCSYVKLDISTQSRAALKATVMNLAPYQVDILAEKVETIDEFLYCKKLGCSLYQGYFLFKPQIVEGEKLSTAKVAVLDLLSEIQNPDTTITDITSIITRDPVLSFKLLALVNSARYRRACEITTISTAVSLLGLTKVRSWASILAMTKLEDKPLSLMLIALQRAEFCSGMATLMVPERQDQFYMVGILSSLDIFFDISMKTLVNKLPINEESKVALLSYSGVIGLALKAAIAYEKFQLDTIDKTGLRKFGITQQDLHTVFLDSNLKAQDYIGSL